MNPAAPWWAMFESTTGVGSFPLDAQALKALGIPEGGTAALEHELLLEYRGETRSTEIYPVPADDEWRPGGNPSVAELTGVRQLTPSDSCACLSGLAFGVCHGTSRPASALLLRA